MGQPGYGSLGHGASCGAMGSRQAAGDGYTTPPERSETPDPRPSVGSITPAGATASLPRGAGGGRTAARGGQGHLSGSERV